MSVAKSLFIKAAHKAFQNLPEYTVKKEYIDISCKSISEIIDICNNLKININNTYVNSTHGDVFMAYTLKIKNNKKSDVNAKEFCRKMHFYYWELLKINGIAISSNNFSTVHIPYINIFNGYLNSNFDEMVELLNIKSMLK